MHIAQWGMPAERSWKLVLSLWGEMELAGEAKVSDQTSWWVTRFLLLLLKADLRSGSMELM
jgi:hypothetical protein